MSSVIKKLSYSIYYIDDLPRNCISCSILTVDNKYSHFHLGIVPAVDHYLFEFLRKSIRQDIEILHPCHIELLINSYQSGRREVGLSDFHYIVDCDVDNELYYEEIACCQELITLTIDDKTCTIYVYPPIRDDKLLKGVMNYVNAIQVTRDNLSRIGLIRKYKLSEIIEEFIDNLLEERRSRIKSTLYKIDFEVEDIMIEAENEWKGYLIPNPNLKTIDLEDDVVLVVRTVGSKRVCISCHPVIEDQPMLRRVKEILNLSLIKAMIDKSRQDVERYIEEIIARCTRISEPKENMCDVEDRALNAVARISGIGYWM